MCGEENEIKTHHIHVVIWNSQSWINYVNFRDYMNSHEEEAKAYEMLKEQLAEMYPENRKAYTAGKKEFIESILQKASLWRNRCQA